MLTTTDTASSNAASLAIPPVAVVLVCLGPGRVMPEHPGYALSGFAGDFRGDVAVGVHGQWETQKSRNATAAGETTSYNM